MWERERGCDVTCVGEGEGVCDVTHVGEEEGVCDVTRVGEEEGQVCAHVTHVCGLCMCVSTCFQVAKVTALTE